MEKDVFERLLFDFYGELLTDKQKKILDYYYNDDYNLAEIGDLVHVTRQGVYDSVKRAKGMMRDYEAKLGLLTRFIETQELISEAVKELDMLLQKDIVLAHPEIGQELEKIKVKMEKISEDD